MFNPGDIDGTAGAGLNSAYFFELLIVTDQLSIPSLK